jgi:mannose-6-phosphate isomerase-like protein (cupin superfamily)
MQTNATIPSSRRIVSADGSETLTFLETAAETDGARTYLEAELAPGSGTPPHMHTTYSEDFEVLDGTLHVEVDGRGIEVGPGERAFVPAHAVHRFANDSDAPVRFRCALEPASRGFEELQQIGAGLQADGLCRGDLPRKPSHLGIGLILADTTLAGRFRLAMPLLLLLGRRAQRRGVAEELRRRYVSW